MVVLKGENQIERFTCIAERFVLEVSSLEGVSGIVLQGGLTRDFVDEFSDLDMTVFLVKADKELESHIRNIARKEEKRSGVEIDLDIFDLTYTPNSYWDDVWKRKYSKAKIVFDPTGECAKVIEEKLKVSDDFWTRRISSLTEYLSWYCCPLEETAGTFVEAWIKRGDLASAHYCINYGVELIVKLLYALNKEFVPSQKWFLFYSYKLAKIPESYKEDINEVITVKNLSLKELRRRLLIIKRLFSKISSIIKEETNLTLHQLRQQYYRNIGR